MRQAFLLWLDSLPTLRDLQIPQRRLPSLDPPPPMTIGGRTLLLDLSDEEVTRLQEYCLMRDLRGHLPLHESTQGKRSRLFPADATR